MQIQRWGDAFNSDIDSLILGFGNYFLVNDKNTINYGFSYADENSDSTDTAPVTTMRF